MRCASRIGVSQQNMDSMKVLLWPVIISIIGHVALISVSSMIDLHENIKPMEIFTVDIKDPEPFKQTPKEEEKKEIKKPRQDKSAKPINTGNWREDTIDLSSPDTKYLSYRQSIAGKLFRTWKYPEKAKEAGEQGVVVLEIPINPDGSIEEPNIVNSSGSAILDEAAIRAAKAAAPFGQTPDTDLKLHLFVKFLYELKY
jgi:TonB family protein